MLYLFRSVELASTMGKKSNPFILDNNGITRFLDFFIRQVLVDSTASSNILYYQCFKEMGIGEQMLTLTPMKLEGFTTHKVTTKRTVILNVTLGQSQQ